MSVSVREYITSNLKRGVSWEKIRSSLIGVGHKEEFVDEVYKDLKSIDRYKKASMVLLVIIIIGLAFLTYSYIDSMSAKEVIVDIEPIIEEPEVQLTDDDYLRMAISGNDRSQCDNIINEGYKSDCLFLVK